MIPTSTSRPRIAIIGAGPAGLMAAHALMDHPVEVTVFDAMPSAGRKFLLAGKGGMNLTHSEPAVAFRQRYREAQQSLGLALDGMDADGVRAWAAGLGVQTFVGSSGKVFPVDMKAAPLLRAWLAKLKASGVRFAMRHRWTAWAEPDASGRQGLCFDTEDGLKLEHADAVILAVGGASWPRLGSDGAWTRALDALGVPLSPLRPSNCGFHVRPTWSDFFRTRFAGEPLKSVRLSVNSGGREVFSQTGECVVTEHGLEGSLIYAASQALRDGIDAEGHCRATLDLLPQRDAAFVQAEVSRPKGSRSLSTHLKSRLGLQGAKMALLHELVPKDAMADPAALAAAIKGLPICFDATRPIGEAISTAGGVRFEGLDEGLQLRQVPGVFAAGEMLDWEAPTGGYLLTACFATGRLAGQAAGRFVGTSPTAAVG